MKKRKGSKMEYIMTDNSAKAFLKEMEKTFPEHRDNFNGVSNLIELLMEEQLNAKQVTKQYQKMWNKLRATKPPVVVNFPSTISELRDIATQSELLRNLMMNKLEKEYLGGDK